MIQPLHNMRERLRVAWAERAVALKAVSFALIGVVNSAIDFAVFSFAYYYLALPILVSNSMAWVVAVSGSYVMNSTITFATESGRKLAFDRYIGFALSQFAGFLANTLTVWCMVELANTPAWAGKLVAIFVSFAVNFSLSHFVVFRKRETAE
ncbi:MAG: GtrA family protein [Pseudolabrys sp.]|jgi:putative flippase GtrA|nr:GtrA family protein [Pseudolabrys sp.]